MSTLLRRLAEAVVVVVAVREFSWLVFSARPVGQRLRRGGGRGLAWLIFYSPAVRSVCPLVPGDRSFSCFWTPRSEASVSRSERSGSHKELSYHGSDWRVCCGSPATMPDEASWRNRGSAVYLPLFLVCYACAVIRPRGPQPAHLDAPTSLLRRALTGRLCL